MFGTGSMWADPSDEVVFPTTAPTSSISRPPQSTTSRHHTSGNSPTTTLECCDSAQLSSAFSPEAGTDGSSLYQPTIDAAIDAALKPSPSSLTSPVSIQKKTSPISSGAAGASNPFPVQAALSSSASKHGPSAPPTSVTQSEWALFLSNNTNMRVSESRGNSPTSPPSCGGLPPPLKDVTNVTMQRGNSDALGKKISTNNGSRGLSPVSGGQSSNHTTSPTMMAAQSIALKVFEGEEESGPSPSSGASSEAQPSQRRRPGQQYPTATSGVSSHQQQQHTPVFARGPVEEADNSMDGGDSPTSSISAVSDGETSPAKGQTPLPSQRDKTVIPTPLRQSGGVGAGNYLNLSTPPGGMPPQFTPYAAPAHFQPSQHQSKRESAHNNSMGGVATTATGGNVNAQQNPYTSHQLPLHLQPPTVQSNTTVPMSQLMTPGTSPVSMSSSQDASAASSPKVHHPMPKIRAPKHHSPQEVVMHPPTLKSLKAEAERDAMREKLKALNSQHAARIAGPVGTGVQSAGLNGRNPWQTDLPLCEITSLEKLQERVNGKLKAPPSPADLVAEMPDPQNYLTSATNSPTMPPGEGGQQQEFHMDPTRTLGGGSPTSRVGGDLASVGGAGLMDDPSLEVATALIEFKTGRVARAAVKMTMGLQKNDFVIIALDVGQNWAVGTAQPLDCGVVMEVFNPFQRRNGEIPNKYGLTDIANVLRIATEEDCHIINTVLPSFEEVAIKHCHQLIHFLHLPFKVVDSEYSFDRRQCRITYCLDTTGATTTSVYVARLQRELGARLKCRVTLECANGPNPEEPSA